MSTAWYLLRVSWRLFIMPPSADLAVASNMQLLGYTDLEIALEANLIRRNDMRSMKALLLEAPDTQLDPKLQPLIRSWGDVPTAHQLLSLLRTIEKGEARASAFSVRLLKLLYDNALTNERTTHAEVEQEAGQRG